MLASRAAMTGLYHNRKDQFVIESCQQYNIVRSHDRYSRKRDLVRMPDLRSSHAPPAGASGSLDDLLAWTEDDWPRMAALLALRRQWIDRPVPGAAPGLRPGHRGVPRRPTARRCGRSWRACRGCAGSSGPIATSRTGPGSSAIGWSMPGWTGSRPLLRPRDGDLGTLEEGGGGSATRPITRKPTFHRQQGGIWRDARGAAVYLLGARIVHVGRNTDFQIHDAFVDAIGAPRFRRRRGSSISAAGSARPPSP